MTSSQQDCYDLLFAIKQAAVSVAEHLQSLWGQFSSLGILLFIYLFVYLFIIYLFVNSFIYLFVCLYICIYFLIIFFFLKRY